MALEAFRTTMWGRFGKALTLLISLAFVGSMARGSCSSSSKPRLEKGSELPKAQLIALANGEGPVQLERFLGKPVLLNFWATWCGYCVRELPLIEKLHQRYGDRLPILAISDEDPETIRRWLGRDSAPAMTFPVVYDPGARLARQLGVKTIPFSVFLSADGKVAHDVTGVLDEEDAVAQIEKLLK